MLAGASGIDFALLVVAADDGIKPQTLEHLAILDLLSIRRGVIALTKTDSVPPERLAVVMDAIRAAVAGTVLESADILPVSAITGQEVDKLRARLFAEAALTVERAHDARFRLAVDRVFTMSGIGVVVTGTVLSGSVHVGDWEVVSPSGLRARVRSLHTQNRPAEIGQSGDRCALNLAGQGITKEAIRRGDMIVAPELHAPTARIDATLRLLPTVAKPVGQWFPVRLHHAAAEVGARIVLLGDDPIKPGESADIQLVIDRPIAAALPDCYVVRDVSARHTLGGGRFIDLRPPARRRRTTERRAQRAAMAITEPERAFDMLLDTPPFAWDLAVFSRDRALNAGQTERLAEKLRLVLLETGPSRLAISQNHWRNFTSSLLEQLVAYHAENPDLQGIGRERLRLLLQPRLPARAFVVALQKLTYGGELVLDGSFVRLATHTVRLTPMDEAAWSEIAPMLAGAERFRPPRVRDIAASTGRPENDVRRLLKLAGRMGWADEVAHDHFFLRPTVREMVAIIADMAQLPETCHGAPIP
jgi:selenocysteine-specific elongation factor